MCEKYDGVRVQWDGENFIEMDGSIINAPKVYKKQLPSIALDGFLW
jgi:hypothetical protein